VFTVKYLFITSWAVGSSGWLSKV